MRKFFIMACLAAGGLSSARGADDGGPKEFDLVGSKITFSDGSFTVTVRGGGPVSFKYDDVTSIKFDGTKMMIITPKPTGIGEVTDDEASAHLFFRDGRIEADGWPDGKTASASVCDMGGRVVLLLKKWDGTAVNVSGLSRGVYLFRVGNQTIKFMKR